MAGNSSVAGLRELVEPVHAGGGLLGDALDALRPSACTSPGRSRASARSRSRMTPYSSESSSVGARHGAGRLELGALVDQQGGVAAVVEQHVRAGCRRARSASARCTTSTPPASRPSRRRPARRLGVVGGAVRADDDRGGGVVLGGEDVAGDPADVGAERDERLDQHGGLHGHVQRAGDAGARQRLAARRTPRAAPSGRASRARRAGSRCGRTRPARGRRPCSRGLRGRAHVGAPYWAARGGPGDGGRMRGRPRGRARERRPASYVRW